MNFDQILKTAEFVFKDNPATEEVLAYVRGLADFAKLTTPPDTKNALVHINNPNVVLVNRTDIEKLQAAERKLIAISTKLNICEDEDVEAVIDALQADLAEALQNKVEVKCQLDDKGRCAFCEKRFLLTTSCVEPMQN